jgi:hypothetical protein
METILYVTYMQGGIYIHASDNSINYRTRNFVVALCLISTSDMPVKVNYSLDNIVAIAD